MAKAAFDLLSKWTNSFIILNIFFTVLKIETCHCINENLYIHTEKVSVITFKENNSDESDPFNERKKKHWIPCIISLRRSFTSGRNCVYATKKKIWNLTLIGLHFTWTEHQPLKRYCHNVIGNKCKVQKLFLQRFLFNFCFFVFFCVHFASLIRKQESHRHIANNCNQESSLGLMMLLTAIVLFR